jgi:hypothetical protein
MDIGKYYFVNRTIKNWNRLPAAVLGTFPLNIRFLETGLEKQLLTGRNERNKSVAKII